MIDISPELTKSIGATLQLAITHHEVCKAYRRCAKRWKYKKLYKKFDKAADQSGEWRWCLSGILAKAQKPIRVMLNAQTIDTDAAWTVFLADLMQHTLGLVASAKNGYDIAENDGNNTISSKLCDLQEDMECMASWLEAIARQINEQGVDNWLSEQM